MASPFDVKCRIALMSLLLAGCASEPVSLPTQPPDMTGTIVARDRSVSFSQGEPTIHVKTDPGDECGTIFVISSETLIARRTGGDRVQGGSVRDLQVGRTIRVWAEYELRSCPAQSEALVVELVN